MQTPNASAPPTAPAKKAIGRPRNPAKPPVIKVPKLSPFRDPNRPPSQPLDPAPAPKSKQPYLSRESVRNIEMVALRKFRHALYERGLDLSDLM